MNLHWVVRAAIVAKNVDNESVVMLVVQIDVNIPKHAYNGGSYCDISKRKKILETLTGQVTSVSVDEPAVQRLNRMTARHGAF